MRGCDYTMTMIFAVTMTVCGNEPAIGHCLKSGIVPVTMTVCGIEPAIGHCSKACIVP